MYICLTGNYLSHYVAHARTKRPVLSEAVSEYVTAAYVQLRRQYRLDEEREQQYTYASARTLLGIIRMAQALARIRLSDTVDTEDVDEALRLIDVSKASLRDNSSSRYSHGDNTYLSGVLTVVRDLRDEYGQELDMSLVRERAMARGYSSAQIDEAIREYAELDVWQVNPAGTRLVMVE